MARCGRVTDPRSGAGVLGKCVHLNSCPRALITKPVGRRVFRWVTWRIPDRCLRCVLRYGGTVKMHTGPVDSLKKDTEGF